MFSTASGLTAPTRRARSAVARDFLRAALPLLTGGAADAGEFTATELPLAGAAVLSFRQQVRGIPVFGGRVDVTVDAEGQVAGAYFGDLLGEPPASFTPRLGAGEAVRTALLSLGAPGAVPEPLAAEGGTARFANPGGPRLSPFTAEPTLFPIPGAAARLAWRISLDMGGGRWYEIVIDDADGGVLYRHNLVRRATARVWCESRSSRRATW